MNFKIKTNRGGATLLIIILVAVVFVFLTGTSVLTYYLIRHSGGFKATPIGSTSPSSEVVKEKKIETDTQEQAPLVTEEPSAPVLYCHKYTVYEGPFKSSKCYTSDDYEALGYYLSKYSSAEFSKQTSQSTIDFTCGHDYFEDSCKQAKEKKKQAESDMERYNKEILAIISRGW